MSCKTNGGNQGPPGSVPGVPFAKGHDPRRGHGKEGKAGRKSEAFREMARTMIEHPKHQSALRAILQDPDHPAFGAVTKTMWAYGAGVPKQTVEVEGDLPSLRIVRDQAAVVAAVQAGTRDDE